ncbi:MAG: hypothetical protein IPH76_09420 [Xanthomonadales bacterium]|nr:hypothetical protein [Xanthomonadales bacterium]
MSKACLALVLALLAAAGLAQVLPTFPGAEGFGAVASGGRGGRVLYVTSLDPDPNGLRPGSLNWALAQSGPRYILFKVSGVIHAPANVVHGDVTIAGQTSPGGVIVRGLVCDAQYQRNDCGNLVVRHLRSRPAAQLGVPEGGDAMDDALRLDGIHVFMIDRSSFAHATDEGAQVSWASQGTIQRSILAETIGGHAIHGGMLLNYAHPEYPQDQLSIVKNLWFRLYGRLPELNCEASSYGGGPPYSSAECAARPLRVEVSNNLQFDPGIDIQMAQYVDGDPSLGPYRIHLNAVNNQGDVANRVRQRLVQSRIAGECREPGVSVGQHDGSLSRVLGLPARVLLQRFSDRGTQHRHGCGRALECATPVPGDRLLDPGRDPCAASVARRGASA